MQKRLTIVGNSLALIIDKPIRKMLSLGPSRLVEIKTDGRRLVVEAAREPPTPARVDVACTRSVDEGEIEASLPVALVLDAAKVATALWERFAMTHDQFLRLHPEGRRILSYVGWAGSESEVTAATASQRRAVRRFDLCLQQLEFGRTWDEAIAIVLYAIPLEAKAR
ncbi:MAG: AbrB/MazE/SpoVT family DNA-binding domain-containing protein [Proteobacteria bacterium]|nr:AbrB/MazE/SpoVT family DNA-binding domain-containing protein [Pseudomonadota bacterium]